MGNDMYNEEQSAHASNLAGAAPVVKESLTTAPVPDLAAAIAHAQFTLCYRASKKELTNALTAILAAAKATSAPGCSSATIEGEPGHESCSVCGHPFPSDSCGALRRCEVR